jgi:hypothetical protein
MEIHHLKIHLRIVAVVGNRRQVHNHQLVENMGEAGNPHTEDIPKVQDRGKAVDKDY